MKKKLTVIIPSYNFENYIEDCVVSVYNQKTNFEFNVILRDDGSTDNTKEKLKSLQVKFPDITILEGVQNIGSFENIKLLYENSNSEYISYLDGDDILTDDQMLQKQIDFLDNNPEYIMSFTGCRYLYENGDIHPNDTRYICSVKDLITTKDLLEKNYVGFGRVFRKIPNILKSYYKDAMNVDWCMSYELSKFGLIKYLDFSGGLYRISDSGVYSKISEEKKVYEFNRVKNLISKDYLNKKYKTLTIIDSFISNLSVLEKLKKAVTNFKNKNHTILLVSNTAPPEDVIKSVDYFLYNHENKLFTESYENLNKVNLWKAYDNIIINEITEELQKHGLSVLCNLFNCLDLAKSLGFTHFQRIEVDDLYSETGYEFMKKVPQLCEEGDKKSLFYINEGEDVSFHYFYSEIDFFIKNFPRITSEESYKNFLENSGFGNSFKPVEVYLYHNLKNGDIDNVLVRNGKTEMNYDFDGTVWNTESSQSTLPSFYGGCTTKLYYVKNQETKVVLSFNYTNIEKIRKINVVFDDGDQQIIIHKLPNKGYYYHTFTNTIKTINVYDFNNDDHLFDIENKDIEDYIEFK